MENSDSNTPEHPGMYIRNEVLPKGLSIKKAAEILDVGRQALSDLLNGNASLSQEMAIRLEKAFPARANRTELLRLQEVYDEFTIKDKARGWAVRQYAEHFLKITSTSIEAYFRGRIRPRQELAAFLRRLANTTNDTLGECDFPAYDDSEQPGWDGQITASSASNCIPLGKSGWEFGVNAEPTGKANDDYRNRTKDVPEDERRETTFVFVSPLKWPKKDEWIKKKRKEGKWKDVRAYDATDLEQWLEQSFQTQCWFGDLIGLSQDDEGIKTLDQCWKFWSETTQPALNEELFKDAIESFRKKPVEDWLNQKPERALVIEADSALEALAFFHCVFKKFSQKLYDRCVVIESANAYKNAKRFGTDFICIINSEDVEKLAAGSERIQHVIIIRPKGSSEKKPDISLEKPILETFKEALKAMGIKDQETGRYARESGRSPTILRRRLSTNEAIKTPPWARDQGTTDIVVPFILAGHWDSRKPGDKEVLEQLCGVDDYKEVEQRVNKILKAPESPLHVSHAIRKVTAKIDALFAIKAHVTEDHIREFIFFAEYVLSDIDPALKLPEDQRPFAALYGEVRQLSAQLRSSLCDTLIILSVFGKDLFDGKFSLSPETEVLLLIRKLLDSGRKNRWIEHQNELPAYAEASPDEFMDIIEKDLKTDEPDILILIQPVKSGVFSSCPRSGLLWALETLAWDPDRLPRVCLILAQLSLPVLSDNYTNKPINTLISIFRSWMPQTKANLDLRKRALDLIMKRYPKVGWDIAMKQLESGNRVGHFNNRPKWRSEAAGSGQPVSRGECIEFEKHALERTLNWPSHDEHTLGELIARMSIMGDEYCSTLWKQVEGWLAANPTDQQKANLREIVRKFAFTRRGHKHLKPATRKKAGEMYALLCPENAIYRYYWLFEKQWVEESYEDIENEDFDFRKWEKRVLKLRGDALKDIYGNLGEDGIDQLLELSESGYPAGWILANGVLTKPRLKSLIRRLAEREYSATHSNPQLCLNGIFVRLFDTERTYFDKLLPQLAEAYLSKGDDKFSLNILFAAPFCPETWIHLERLPNHIQDAYWAEATPRWFGKDPEGLKTMIEKLLEANRALDAFGVAHLDWDIISSADIIRLLDDLGKQDLSNPRYYDLREYELTKAFETLNSREKIHPDKLAGLELKYIQAFRHSEYKLPNLSKQVSEQPFLFTQALALAYKRSDEGVDPEELGLGDNKNNSDLIDAAHSLIDGVTRIPGTQPDGKVNEIALSNWLTETRALCKKYAREKIGDHMIGQLLSQSPLGDDGIWPCEPVRESLEKIASAEIASGMRIGIYNRRGARILDAGRREERKLARKYRNWSRDVAYEYPYIAKMLEEIARSYDHNAEIWGIEDDLFDE